MVCLEEGRPRDLWLVLVKIVKVAFLKKSLAKNFMFWVELVCFAIPERACSAIF
jgi:hypothetical protein